MVNFISTTRKLQTKVGPSVQSPTGDWAGLRIYDALWVAYKHSTGILVGDIDDDGDGRVTYTYNDG
jgi:hypothetical protein